jgi:hypothetical protein
VRLFVPIEHAAQAKAIIEQDYSNNVDLGFEEFLDDKED